MPLRDALDVRCHRGGEQRNLTFCRQLAEDGFHCIGKAHGEHFVGFVQNHGGDAFQRQRAAIQVIHDATRGAHNDVGAAAQRIELRRIALAAIDRQHMKALQAGGVFLKGFGDLDGQFASGHQHQGLRRLFADVDAREDRQRKGCSLAGTSLSLPQYIGAFEQGGDGGSLDGGGRFVADCGYCREDLFRQTKIGESNGLRRFGSIHAGGGSSYGDCRGDSVLALATFC